MRLWIAAFLAVFAAPAAAQDSPSDQAIAAYQTFYQGLQSEGVYEGGYFDAVTAGIAGKWTAGTYVLLNDSPDAETLQTKLNEACSGPIVAELSVVEPFTLRVRNPRRENEFTQDYLYTGGVRFSSQLDAKAFLEYLHLTEDRMRQSAIASLASAALDVLIFRPSADVLVIARTSGQLDIYTRCEEDAGSVDTAALEAALGEAFDAQFPKAKRPEVRATFIACAAEALAPLSPADLQIAIDSGFNPPEADRVRIENLYPEVNAAAGACAEAAETALRR